MSRTVPFCLQGHGAALSIRDQQEDAGANDEETAAVGASADREQFSIPKLLKQHVVEVRHPPPGSSLPLPVSLYRGKSSRVPLPWAGRRLQL